MKKLRIILNLIRI